MGIIDMAKITNMHEKAILAELSKRIKNNRILYPMTQCELTDKFMF